MNENEKVKTGLLYCASSKDAPAGACPYGKSCEDCDGIQRLKAEALTAIIRTEAGLEVIRDNRDLLQQAYETTRRAAEQYKAERDAALERFRIALADLQLVGETGNPCVVCGYYHPELPGDRKCDLMGTHCAWMWAKLQRSDYLRGGFEDGKGEHIGKDH